MINLLRNLTYKNVDISHREEDLCSVHYIVLKNNLSWRGAERRSHLRFSVDEMASLPSFQRNAVARHDKIWTALLSIIVHKKRHAQTLHLFFHKERRFRQCSTHNDDAAVIMPYRYQKWVRGNAACRSLCQIKSPAIKKRFRRSSSLVSVATEEDDSDRIS